MEYRIRESGAILTQGEVRKLYANTSFPAVWDQAVCDEIGIDPILESPQPTTTRFQSASRTGVVQDDLGNWVHSWTVTNWDQVAIDAATEARWTEIRTQRNQLLADSDWTQLADNPLTNVQQAEWATYRQALRDVTSQEDPFNITWPTKP